MIPRPLQKLGGDSPLVSTPTITLFKIYLLFMKSQSHVAL